MVVNKSERQIAGNPLSEAAILLLNEVLNGLSSLGCDSSLLFHEGSESSSEWKRQSCLIYRTKKKSTRKPVRRDCLRCSRWLIQRSSQLITRIDEFLGSGWEASSGGSVFAGRLPEAATNSRIQSANYEHLIRSVAKLNKTIKVTRRAYRYLTPPRKFICVPDCFIAKGLNCVIDRKLSASIIMCASRALTPPFWLSADCAENRAIWQSEGRTCCAPGGKLDCGFGELSFGINNRPISALIGFSFTLHSHFDVLNFHRFSPLVMILLSPVLSWTCLLLKMIHVESAGKGKRMCSQIFSFH